MRRRLVVGSLLKNAPVAAALIACPVAHATSVQTVFSAENALYGAGYNVGQADGWIDESLRKAIRQYQADHSGLTSTGELDSMTLKALGISSKSSQVVDGNAVTSRADALAELGLSQDRFEKASAKIMAAAPQPERKPKPTPKSEPQPDEPEAVNAEQPKVEKEPEPDSSAVAANASAAKPDEPKPKAVAQSPAKAPTPSAKTAQQSVPEPQVAKPEPITASRAEAQTLKDPEPDSEPVQITSSFGFSENGVTGNEKVSAEESEQDADTVTASNSGDVETLLPQEPTAAGLAPDSDPSATPASKESEGNVFTRVFSFLFGWMV